ncbi:hypothetical protein DV735_g4446, partial [Chaetothyriales sp. CBS 134920]
MADWKDRGYVPDSDDDDEDNLICADLNDDLPPDQRPTPPRLRSNSPRQARQARQATTTNFEIVVSPTASKLQAELQRGLQACKDVLATSPDLAAYLEAEDSPLSSLASSPSLGPVDGAAPRPPISPQQQPIEPPSVAVMNSSPPQLRLDDTPQAPYLSAGPIRRSLRPRTLLQLNPYSLEYARYQQECSRRGIVPVRLANFAAERAKASGNDTQVSDPFQESDFSSSPSRSQVSVIGIPDEGTDESRRLAGGPQDIWSTLGDDDDLPELSDLLLRPDEETSPVGPESQASESENDDSQGLLQIRRRIRGVLPASWLKLDAKQRTQKTAIQPPIASENIVQSVKGVAKHISPTRPRDSPHASAHKPIIFSSDVEDDSVSENEHENGRLSTANLVPNAGVWESDAEMDALALEDEIDRMLPSLVESNNLQATTKAVWLNEATTHQPKGDDKTGNQASDAIVKFWFKQYAQNDMIELFVVPDVGRVTERSKRVALDLATEHSDTDYDIFLKLVAALLETRAQSMAFCSDDMGRAAGRIQSLIFSISPNNSRKLSDDQSLHLEDLVSMANIYALYEYLNEFAPPGCQPRFALVEKLIDFPNCHWSVSQFALRTWSRFAHNAINRADISILNILGSWIKRMTEQMSLKLPPMPNDRHEPRPTGAEYALQRNVTGTRQQIAELLSTWKAALARCPSDNECKTLLNGGAIGAIVDFCKDARLCTAEVVSNVCELVQKYLDRADTDPGNMVRATLHKQFRQIMIAILSSEAQISTECLKPLTSLWYSFARITVRNKQKTWDDYLSLPSSWSFGLLAASDSSRQCKVLFLKMILEHDMVYFELDHEPFYSAWIQGIVQPQCNLLFEHELTKSIILHETDEMSFEDLRSMLRGGQGQLRLEMADFKQKQFEIVKHVVRSVFLLQFDDEDSQDYLGKPLNIDQGRRLLKLMTDTIKACWRALPLANREAYTEFARAVVTQLRIYKYKGFDIDPWFIDPQRPEFPKEVPFAGQFLLPINQPRPELDERLIRIFTAGNLQAAGTAQERAWSEDIIQALSATSATSAVDTKGKLALNSDLQFAFMRQVMSVHVCSIFRGPGHALFARPILSGILELVRNWHFRLDINSDIVLHQMLFTALDLLASIFEALAAVRSRLASFIGHGGEMGALINVLIDLSSACVRRVTMLEPLVEKSDRNLDAVEEGYVCANELYETLLPLCPGRHHTAGIPPGNTNDTVISKTSLMSKTQTILDESLRGRNGQIWRIDHPLANSWDAWMVKTDEDAGDFGIALKKLRHALVEADMLLADDGNDWAEDDEAVLL